MESEIVVDQDYNWWIPLIVLGIWFNGVVGILTLFDRSVSFLPAKWKEMYQRTGLVYPLSSVRLKQDNSLTTARAPMTDHQWKQMKIVYAKNIAVSGIFLIGGWWIRMKYGWSPNNSPFRILNASHWFQSFPKEISTMASTDAKSNMEGVNSCEMSLTFCVWACLLYTSACVWSIVILNSISGAWFYHWHRWCHTDANRFKWIHKQHHEYQEPFAMEAIYCTTTEMILLNLPAVVLGPWILLPDPWVVTLWYMLAATHVPLVHSGRHWKWAEAIFAPSYHDLHHRFYTCNYGSDFCASYLIPTQTAEMGLAMPTFISLGSMVWNNAQTTRHKDNDRRRIIDRMASASASGSGSGSRGFQSSKRLTKKEERKHRLKGPVAEEEEEEAKSRSPAYIAALSSDTFTKALAHATKAKENAKTQEQKERETRMTQQDNKDMYPVQRALRYFLTQDGSVSMENVAQIWTASDSYLQEAIKFVNDEPSLFRSKVGARPSFQVAKSATPKLVELQSLVHKWKQHLLVARVMENQAVICHQENELDEVNKPVSKGKQKKEDEYECPLTIPDFSDVATILDTPAYDKDHQVSHEVGKKWLLWVEKHPAIIKAHARVQTAANNILKWLKSWKEAKLINLTSVLNKYLTLITVDEHVADAVHLYTLYRFVEPHFAFAPFSANVNNRIGWLVPGTTVKNLPAGLSTFFEQHKKIEQWDDDAVELWNSAVQKALVNTIQDVTAASKFSSSSASTSASASVSNSTTIIGERLKTLGMLQLWLKDNLQETNESEQLKTVWQHQEAEEQKKEIQVKEQHCSFDDPLRTPRDVETLSAMIPHEAWKFAVGLDIYDTNEANNGTLKIWEDQFSPELYASLSSRFPTFSKHLMTSGQHTSLFDDTYANTKDDKKYQEQVQELANERSELFLKIKHRLVAFAVEGLGSIDSKDLKDGHKTFTSEQESQWEVLRADLDALAAEDNSAIVMHGGGRITLKDLINLYRCTFLSIVHKTHERPDIIARRMEWVLSALSYWLLIKETLLRLLVRNYGLEDLSPASSSASTSASASASSPNGTKTQHKTPLSKKEAQQLMQNYHAYAEYVAACLQRRQQHYHDKVHSGLNDMKTLAAQRSLLVELVTQQETKVDIVPALRNHWLWLEPTLHLMEQYTLFSGMLLRLEKQLHEDETKHTANVYEALAFAIRDVGTDSLVLSCLPVITQLDSKSLTLDELLSWHSRVMEQGLYLPPLKALFSKINQEKSEVDNNKTKQQEYSQALADQLVSHPWMRGQSDAHIEPFFTAWKDVLLCKVTWTGSPRLKDKFEKGRIHIFPDISNKQWLTEYACPNHPKIIRQAFVLARKILTGEAKRTSTEEENQYKRKRKTANAKETNKELEQFVAVESKQDQRVLAHLQQEAQEEEMLPEAEANLESLQEEMTELKNKIKKLEKQHPQYKKIQTLAKQQHKQETELEEQQTKVMKLLSQYRAESKKKEKAKSTALVKAEEELAATTEQVAATKLKLAKLQNAHPKIDTLETLVTEQQDLQLHLEQAQELVERYEHGKRKRSKYVEEDVEEEDAEEMLNKELEKQQQVESKRDAADIVAKKQKTLKILLGKPDEKEQDEEEEGDIVEGEGDTDEEDEENTLADYPQPEAEDNVDTEADKTRALNADADAAVLAREQARAQARLQAEQQANNANPEDVDQNVAMEIVRDAEAEQDLQKENEVVMKHYMQQAQQQQENKPNVARKGGKGQSKTTKTKSKPAKDKHKRSIN